jgi:FAD:protein FMN transferase
MRPASASARRSRPLLGTFVEIQAGGVSRGQLDAAIEETFRIVAQVHRLMSPRDPNSDVSRLNREAWARAVTVHPWTSEVLGTALELQAATGGLFDIGVAPSSWVDPLPPRPAIELMDGHRVHFVRPDLSIDLGGIAKGFAVDRAVASLRARDVPHGVVNAGGDVAAFGRHATPIAIRDPRHPRSILCQLELTNEALASSGGRIDLFESAPVTASAVLDPRTGAPARTILGATVRASTCMAADALTKVVMLGGESMTALLAHYRASALFLAADGELHITSDWSGRVRLAA